MNQNKDYDRNDRVTDEELRSLNLKISPRKGLLYIGVIFIIILIMGMIALLVDYFITQF